MTTKTNAEKTNLELSCREACLILRIIPMRKNVKDMKEEEITAIKHYLYCKPCRDRGLADIIDTKISCQEAILVWAEHPGALYLKFLPGLCADRKTLIEEYAVEHVWGKYQWKNSMGGNGYDNSTACRENTCCALASYWHDVPMSSSAGDGASGVIYEFPFLIKIFLKNKWPLDELFTLQKKRVAKILENIKNRKITVSSSHYHSIDELTSEIQEHFTILQEIMGRPQV